MRTVTEPSRQIPVVAEADVVVCGGGPGGFSAAISAARQGAKTVLIERYGFLGGAATAGLVSPLLGHTASESNVPIVEGLLRELTERMHAIGGAQSWAEAVQDWGIHFDAEAMKITLDEMCLEAGVELILHTYVADVVMDGDQIGAIIVENKSGRQAVVGKVFVDATGDADVAYRAGAPTTHGRPFDQRPMSMGTFIHMSGLPSVDANQAAKLREMIQQETINGRFCFYDGRFLDRCAYHKDHTAANMTRYGGDPNSGEDMTQAELSIRENTWKLVRYLRESVPGFEGVYVQQTSPGVTPRESRQIVGPYVLTGQDVSTAHKFDDAIARGSWWIDIHCPMGWAYPAHLCRFECPKEAECPFWAAEHERMFHHAELFVAKGDWYDIPYRSLLSIGVPNLLSSGRCISATHEGMAGSRVMGTCIAIGQAAGTAAALAVDGNLLPTELDAQQLRAVLRENGQLV